MKKLLVLITVTSIILCFNLINGVRSQGYLHQQTNDLTPHSAYRRQLTQTQQSQILSDVQKHQLQQQQQHQQQQHRFNLHHHHHQSQVPSQSQPSTSSQKQFLIQQQPSIEIQSLNQQQQQQQQQQHNNIINQRPPPPNQVRFSPNRNNSPPPTILQHHTQTNFIPNFNQQQPPTHNSAQFQQRPAPQNQLQLPQQSFRQQPPPHIQSQSQSNKVDENNFHAQNFIDLKNHYSQQQHQPQTQQKPLSQPHHQQQQPQPLPQPQPQITLPQNQNFIQPQSPTAQLPVIPPAQFQTQPQQQQLTPTFHTLSQPQFPTQSQPQFTGPTNFQTFPQILPTPSQQQFHLLPPFQGVPQFQTVPQIQSIQQFQPTSQFQTFPQFPVPPPSTATVIDPANFQTAPQISGATRIISDQETKQRLVQKHEAFVQKQYEKQQNRVKQLHDEFIQKQQSIKETGSNRRPSFDQTTPTAKSRPLLPTEIRLFEDALRKYNDEHPTTTVTTTTTSQKTTTKATDDPLDILLQAQRKDIYSQLKLESERTRTTKSSKTKSKPAKTLGRDELLKQLRLALAENPPPGLGNKTFDATDVVLPNGQKVQVIRTSDPSVISGKRQISNNFLPISQTRTESSNTNTPDRIKQVAPERSKDLVLPNGHKVEIVRAPGNAASDLNLPSDIANLYSQSETQIISSDEPPSLEELAKRGLIPEGYEIAGFPGNSASKSSSVSRVKAPPPTKKKPTFVYLEEQSDGTFKIQGVKTSPEGETKTSGAEVESILDRIQKGEIKLPPSVKKVQLPPSDTRNQLPTFSTPQPPFPTLSTSTQKVKVTFPSSTVSPYSTLTPLINRGSTAHQAAASNTHETTSVPEDDHGRNIYLSSTSTTTTTTTTSVPITEKLVRQAPYSQPDLIQILKSNGLFAMAKYLKQSGLDSILNETGPYTIFAPTDKAFKNLLIQLGGPERAEEKFKANPRLLSGLLLHHVIPGSFEISSLQDEMTGVSLAGTQLRVNQYMMHDQEWNDVLITTINGAMVVNDKQDIKIPQGIAHGVDRVMFPLPVGDLLQTLQSDRENRFTTFLKILQTSGMTELLLNRGTKTYTVFAPTNHAFESIDRDELEKLQTDKDYSQAFAMKHIMPSTLFSAGMRFYQVKDSLQPTKTITIQKTSSGKIKVNESQMITSNIPATNGVIHALDGLL